MRRISTFLYSLCLAAMVCCPEPASGKGAAKDEPLIQERKWEEAEAAYAKKLVEFAEVKGPKADKRLMDLVLCYHISRYFPKMTGEDITGLSDWLLDETDFAAKLLGAFDPKDSPDRVFHVLAQIKSKFGAQKVLKYQGLAIAHAVVWDKEKPISKKFDATDSFGYYVSNARSAAFDLANLPYEPALFLACAQAAPDERLWALKGYKRPKTLSAIYHAPEYDTEFLFGKKKKIDGHEYTLQNILKYGGICGDRSYFAANVARALGIPAASIGGRGERGGHAWTGYIQPGNPGAYLWDLKCGRYAYDHYYVGTTSDPQTGERMNDYELAMRTKGCALPPDKVRLADCYVCLAEIMEKEQKFPLVKWALEQAIKYNEFNLTAWHAMTRLCKAGSFEPEYADHLLDVALQKFPAELDFCYGLFDTLMAAIPEEKYARRVRLYQQAANFFKPRPDLAVAVGRDYGDYLLDQGKKQQAFDVYHNTIRAHMDDPMLVADLAIKVTDRRMEADEPKKAVALLQPLIRLSQRPSTGDPFAKDSAWYRLQACLKKVYTQMNDDKSAAAIEAELSKFRRQ